VRFLFSFLFFVCLSWPFFSFFFVRCGLLLFFHDPKNLG